MKRRKFSLAWALAVAFMGAVLVPASTAFAAARDDASTSSSESDSTSGNNNVEGSPKARTVPTWTSSFTDPTNGVSYPFTIVGSDPRLGRSTTVRSEIIPLKFKFVAGNQDVSVLNVPARGYVAQVVAATMNGADDVADTIASPVFTPTNFAVSADSGVQFGDAVMRAQFGKVGTGYHVKLGRPKVMETVTIRVPATKGVAVSNPLGVLVGRVDADWFKQRLERL